MLQGNNALVYVTEFDFYYNENHKEMYCIFKFQYFDLILGPHTVVLDGNHETEMVELLIESNLLCRKNAFNEKYDYKEEKVIYQDTATSEMIIQDCVSLAEDKLSISPISIELVEPCSSKAESNFTKLKNAVFKI